MPLSMWVVAFTAGKNINRVSHVWLCDPPDDTVREILQARILEWVAFPFSEEILPTQGSNPDLLS